ncbi:hypothetical protein [Rubritalea tangerina]|uniref:EF-hand domain-containing protein n=1 Tax=Rubritalea tangerina TaxID=430798 RepID=A0ABW4Z971_9BACT
MFAQYDVKFIKTLDVNGDLETNETELRQGIRNQLLFFLNDKLKVDQNNDQRLTLKEYALSVPARSDEKDEDGFDWHQRGHFQRDDKNKDGFIDLTEMLGHTTKGIKERAMLVHASLILKKADTNNDSVITKDEFLAINKEAEPVWNKAVKGNSHIELSNAYPTLYWLSIKELSMLTDA